MANYAFFSKHRYGKYLTFSGVQYLIKAKEPPSVCVTECSDLDTNLEKVLIAMLWLQNLCHCNKVAFNLTQ